MNYDSILSLVLSNDCVISKFKFIEGEAVDTTDDEDPIAHQDADFVLMTGTLKRILQDLTKQLGGYAPVSHQPTKPAKYHGEKRMKRFNASVAVVTFWLLVQAPFAESQNALVFQTDFGLEEPAVASMKGVAYGVSPELNMFDITHEIPVFNIWEGAYRLNQTAKYWPKGTVFVSVVDPGVGTARGSVVLKTESGHYFVSPDNGSLTLVAEELGIEAVREIDETTNRLPGSEESHTFHGRDVFAYTAARLAAGIIGFEQVGPLREKDVVRIAYQRPALNSGKIAGNVPILDIHYGNVWTNVSSEMFEQLGVGIGDLAWVKISNGEQVLFEKQVKYVRSFGGVPVGESMLYVNDLLKMGIAINQGNFAGYYQVSPGPDTRVEIWK